MDVKLLIFGICVGMFVTAIACIIEDRIRAKKPIAELHIIVKPKEATNEKAETAAGETPHL